jgi:hypothetical protein
MAKVNNNATDRMRGRVDQFVYRDCNGETIAAKKPGKSKKPPTETQQEARKKFRRASRYAKSVMNDPMLSEVYAGKVKPGNTIYNLAFSDYYDAPDIDLVKVERYAGNIGDIISSVVDDKFKVASVKVKINRADGTLIEEGDAIMGADGLQWNYTCTVANASTSGCVVTITATDLPGNSSVEQKTL